MNFAILTVSDTRTLDNDESGRFLVGKVKDSQHQLLSREIRIDNIYEIRAVVSQWIVDVRVDVILITGGTGLMRRDVTPEAVLPLCDRVIPGFGELFRQISYNEIGLPALQSRAFSAMVNDKLIYCLPGSLNAVMTAWDKILGDQFQSNPNRQCSRHVIKMVEKNFERELI